MKKLVNYKIGSFLVQLQSIKFNPRSPNSPQAVGS